MDQDNEKKTYLQESTQIKIELLCSISGDEERSFTGHQLDLINFLKTGSSPADVAKEWECSISNVNQLIARCVDKLEAVRSRPEKKRGEPKVRNIIDYQKFADADLSILSDREKQLLQTRIEHPELSNQELADMHGILPSSYATRVSIAIKKLQEGAESYHERHRQYYKENREKMLAARKKYYDSHKEQCNEYGKGWWARNRDAKLEKQRTYTKAYYQEHREEILRKQKERKQQKRDTE